MSEVLTVQEAAERAKLHENTIYRALRSGKLVGSKVGEDDGAVWRIFAEDLEQWLRSQRYRPEDHPRRPRRSGTPARQRGSLRALEAIDGGQGR